MSKQKLGQLWGIIGVASVIIMFIVAHFTGWGFAWICPVVGVLVGMICNFVLGKDE